MIIAKNQNTRKNRNNSNDRDDKNTLDLTFYLIQNDVPPQALEAVYYSTIS